MYITNALSLTSNSNMNEIKAIVVNQIIGGSSDGHSRVTLANDTFNAVRGLVPTLAFVELLGDTGERMRAFEVDGVTLYSVYDAEARKTTFFMKTEDANKCLLNRDPAPFKLSEMDRTYRTSGTPATTEGAKE